MRGYCSQIMERWGGKPGGITSAGGGALGIDILMAIITNHCIWLDKLLLTGSAHADPVNCPSVSVTGTQSCYTHILTANPKPVTHNQHLILLFESLEADADDIQLAKRLSYWG